MLNLFVGVVLVVVVLLIARLYWFLRGVQVKQENQYIDIFKVIEDDPDALGLWTRYAFYIHFTWNGWYGPLLAFQFGEGKQYRIRFRKPWSLRKLRIRRTWYGFFIAWCGEMDTVLLFHLKPKDWEGNFYFPRVCFSSEHIAEFLAKHGPVFKVVKEAPSVLVPGVNNLWGEKRYRLWRVIPVWVELYTNADPDVEEITAHIGPLAFRRVW